MLLHTVTSYYACLHIAEHSQSAQTGFPLGQPKPEAVPIGEHLSSLLLMAIQSMGPD